VPAGKSPSTNLRRLMRVGGRFVCIGCKYCLCSLRSLFDVTSGRIQGGTVVQTPDRNQLVRVKDGDRVRLGLKHESLFDMLAAKN